MDTALNVLDRHGIEYRMIDIKLPFWLENTQLLKLVAAVKTWWDLVETWIKYPLTQFDELTCSGIILNLWAYQRDIKRLPNEPLNLYRLRVKYALINAQDAGSVAGFIAIFARLGLGTVTLIERFDEIDWDVIQLVLTDEQIAGNEQLLIDIIRLYGRTCRRYQFSVFSEIQLSMTIGGVGCEYSYSTAAVSNLDFSQISAWDGGGSVWDNNESLWN